MTKGKTVEGQTDDKVVASVGDAKLVLQKTKEAQGGTKAGTAGPESALEAGHSVQGVTPTGAKVSKTMKMDVQVHTGDEGLKVVTVMAESGDDAANQVLAMEEYRRASIRGITPHTDPDPNSLGGERDAEIMYANGENAGDTFNRLGTDANVEATQRLARGDVTELRD